MDLISLLIMILVVGLLLWVVGLLPLPEPFKTAAYVVVVVIVIIYLIGMLGGLPPLRVR